MVSYVGIFEGLSRGAPVSTISSNQRAGSDGSMSASGSAGPGIGGVEMYTF